MTDGVPEGSQWRRSRYVFAGFCFVSLMVFWFALRLVLFLGFKPDGVPLDDLLGIFWTGFYRDAFAALILTLPMLGWMMIVPERWFAARWHRAVFMGACALACFVQIFLLFVEFFFFEEFRSRFNTVAVDYLWSPQEVFVNIWESYHVGVIVAICAVASLGWAILASHLFARMWTQRFSAISRFVHFAAAVVIAAALVPAIRLSGIHISNDRIFNEMANNGALAFVAAAWTRQLDYAAFYKTIPRDEAYHRVRRLLAQQNVGLEREDYSIRRQVAGDPSLPRFNVVLLLEESLGSEFWGSLGRQGQTLTPEMDRLAAEEGMLFTNIYASGNRTVRGFEGVLSSFPPLPGDSIVKRNFSDNVETIARVLKRDGYETVFLYGGRGIFDGMRSFALRNGYDRFIEQKHFKKPTFTTAWGVCDEDLFARTIEELREMASAGKPFFATVLSVSNHKPYTYPKGRIPEDPDRQKREHAVKYSDFALGEFFRAAKREPFWTNTLFAVVADHGARVYGSQSIPIHSYEIPVLLAGSALIHQPSRVPQLGCSLDVAPTLLGLIGRPYETMFFGHDLLKCRPEDGRVFINHNRDIGMLAHDRLVVLGLMHTAEFYEGNPKEVDMSPMTNPGKAEEEIERDAIAVYQVADDLYMHQRYRIAPAATSTSQDNTAAAVSGTR